MNNIILPTCFSLNEELSKIFAENNPFLKDRTLKPENLTDDDLNDLVVSHNPLINSAILPYKEEFIGKYEWVIESPITNFNYAGGYKVFEKEEVLEKFPPKKEGFIESNIYHLVKLESELRRLLKMMRGKGIPLPKKFMIVSLGDKVPLQGHDHSVVMIVHTSEAEEISFQFDFVWGLCFDHTTKILRVKKIL
ncbi:hypothetical protein SDC9_07840 [bioreactor metagenome]|uniref:Uncharacterized protein n=1 Tax=bioreactor metagenome TaxID=1076179 RepID=A0A644T8J5_9ZZZZ|nr:hypothetical protein [Candidatus Elulimicrobiales bacterium]